MSKRAKSVEKSFSVIEDNSTNKIFENVGRVRLSKAGGAVSIKLLKEKRYFHIAVEDIKKIIDDTERTTVGNVREYYMIDKKE